MALDATAGGTSSDAYCTLAEANSYNDAHPASADWDGTDTAKENSIKTATMWLDQRVDWVGAKSSSEQALRWPRYSVLDLDGYTVDSDSIPLFLKRVTAELARHILDDGDLSAEPDGKGLSSSGVGSIQISYDKTDVQSTFPSSVSEMLRGWGTVSHRSGFASVSVQRV